MKKFLKAMQNVTDFVIGKPAPRKKRKYKRRSKK